MFLLHRIKFENAAPKRGFEYIKNLFTGAASTVRPIARQPSGQGAREVSGPGETD
jgi:hypothetical protein